MVNDLIAVIRGVVVVGLIATVIMINPIITSVIGGVLWSRNYSASMMAGYGERNYQRVCPRYKEASTWDRWFKLNHIGWCSDYIERL